MNMGLLHGCLNVITKRCSFFTSNEMCCHFAPAANLKLVIAGKFIFLASQLEPGGSHIPTTMWHGASHELQGRALYCTMGCAWTKLQLLIMLPRIALRQYSALLRSFLGYADVPVLVEPFGDYSGKKGLSCHQGWSRFSLSHELFSFTPPPLYCFLVSHLHFTF